MSYLIQVTRSNRNLILANFLARIPSLGNAVVRPGSRGVASSTYGARGDALDLIAAHEAGPGASP
jgi:hypothetical protein